MSDAAEAALVGGHLKLALAGARAALRRCRGDADDVLSDALLALLTAARTYDPARGPFDRWARLRVRRDVSDGRRARGGRTAASARRRLAASLVPLRRPERGDDPSGLDEPADPRPGPAESYAAAERFRALIAPLSRQARRVLVALYADGLSQREAAAALGHHESWVSVVHRDALAFLRERLGVDASPETPS